MSSESTPDAVADESEPILDLGSVFQHPAGLRTARFIVSSFLRAAADHNTSAKGIFSSVSLPFLDSDASSSEATNILRDVLAFSNTEEPRDGQTDFLMTDDQETGHTVDCKQPQLFVPTLRL
jgi:hypothetical protein